MCTAISVLLVLLFAISAAIFVNLIGAAICVNSAICVNLTISAAICVNLAVSAAICVKRYQ